MTPNFVCWGRTQQLTLMYLNKKVNLVYYFVSTHVQLLYFLHIEQSIIKVYIEHVFSQPNTEQAMLITQYKMLEHCRLF